jgi:hypothetical protein
MINRRSAWILSAMIVGIIAIAALTIGSSAGQFGFGESGSADFSGEEDSGENRYDDDEHEGDDDRHEGDEEYEDGEEEHDEDNDDDEHEDDDEGGDDEEDD